MRILGIDPGSRVCGYGVISVAANPQYRYVECGVLTAEGKAMEMRLGEIAQSLIEVIEELQPAVVAVEDVFARVNIRSALALAQARGAALAVAGMAKLKVFSYPPATVKRSVTGGGAAGKEQVAKMVQSLVGLASAPRSDAADALAVAITHAHHSSFDESHMLNTPDVKPRSTQQKRGVR